MSRGGGARSAALAGVAAWTFLLAGPRPAASQDGARLAPVLPGARSVHVEPSPERVERASRLIAEAEDLRRRLAATEQERSSLLSQARRLDQELALLRAEAGAARLLAGLAQESADAQAERAALLLARRDALRSRVALVARALYVRGPRDPLVSLVAREDGGADVGRVLARRQADLARDVTDASAAAARAARQARAQAAEASAQRARAEEREASVARQAAQRQQALRSIAGRIAADERAAEERERAAADLMADLTPEAIARRRQAAASPAVLPRLRQSRGLGQLPGLEASRGRLAWPLDGRPQVLESWGEVRDPRRGTRTVRHGVVLEARRGETVRAVGDGRVVFADWYKGFGRCLVLDHGMGFLSVVGHADAFSVEAGDEVRAGEPIGVAGDTGSLAGPRLWFQLQRQGTSVNPMEWLAR